MLEMNESANVQCSYNTQYSIWDDVYCWKAAAVGGDNRSRVVRT